MGECSTGFLRAGLMGYGVAGQNRVLSFAVASSIGDDAVGEHESDGGYDMLIGVLGVLSPTSVLSSSSSSVFSD